MMPTKCGGSGTSERSGAATTAAAGGAGGAAAGGGAPPQEAPKRQSHAPRATSATRSIPLRCRSIVRSTLHGFARGVPRSGQRRPRELRSRQPPACEVLDAERDEGRRPVEKTFDHRAPLPEKDGQDPRANAELAPYLGPAEPAYEIGELELAERELFGQVGAGERPVAE